ncbi:MAG: glycosyltransferase [Verrucomicrobia bacterium]|nr:glycosyltransferase [Verrucomicrobiota bacterium]
MKLTISMATHDDYDGVYFTIQSLRLHHDLPQNTEFIILDNNPNSNHGQALLLFSKWVPDARVIPVTDRTSSFVKYDAFHHARGDVILGLDCHVLLQRGFISSMLSYWQTNSDSREMLTGPLLYNDLKATSVKMEPRWRGHDFGTWGNDPDAMAKGVPFEIPMMGMGCFSMLKKTVPTLASGFSGFGAEEWYLAEKVRQNGGRVICHPSLGWNHRFDWPKRMFPLTLEDKVRNYYRGWFDIYQSRDHPMIRSMTEHWLTFMPSHKLELLIAEAQ